MLSLPVYLDNNATTPIDPAVLTAMIPFFTQHFGNAASKNHVFGWEADEAVVYAREQVAALIGAEPNEIIFTSGATESDNLALKGIVEAYTGKGNHIITLNTEHKAVLDTCKHLEKKGINVTYLPVQQDGLIDLSALEAAIQPNTILISVMYAHNEIGVIQPISTISAIAKKYGVLFFTDATQAVGKIPVDVIKDGIDVMAFNAHKMYGPKGIGALYVRRKNPRVKLIAQIDGGGHERGMRSGTLNVPAIVGFGKACALCQLTMKEVAATTSHLRNKLEEALLQMHGVTINGNRLYRLPHVCNASFRNTDGEGLLMRFNKNLAVSSGSACTSASLEPSYVLKALGLSDDLAHSSIRFSLSRFTTEAEIDFAIQQINETLQAERALRDI
ncbi:MAG: IscS subfamily cysteine desulfurase [Bacteroidota bacterium]|jgi:cysteine desulfurase|nr:IscS subfamily cysteine desulfurase [Bacteroidota bacterium]